MKNATKLEIGKAIALLTAEYDLPPFEDVKIEMWMRELARYPAGSVQRSAENFIRTSKFKPQLSEIVKGCEAQTPTLWLTSDEAWARMPKTEAESAMLCQETAEALALAMPLLADGEESAARLAFRGAYNRLVEKAKIEGRAPAYFLAQGSDRGHQVEVLLQAVSIGQIGVDQAKVIMPMEAERIERAVGKPGQSLLGHVTSSAVGRAKTKALLLTLKPKMFGADGVES